MAIFREDFYRCPNCGGVEFEERRIGELPKHIKAFPPQTQVTMLSWRWAYFCRKCGQEVERGA